ncbi:probable LRR receptor-like serine/threonine-protein kinase At1g53440 [Typha angustifolia]|uniref:probable LRR receptor-like serine/threonine-protein kinase At1g53440 n=1 Tax=Typha angustifolia TaxID=59011 RepID=UPI003C2E1AD9
MVTLQVIGYLALEVIGSKLGTEWNFSVNPCDRTGGWFDPQGPYRDITNQLTCDCNTTSNVCHVISIWLKGQNLTGVLPDELAALTFLSSIDLSRNYLNGSIPAKWASLPLIRLSLLGNRISGRIPKEIGSITTLQEIVLEGNQLQGPIPASLGDLFNLERLLLSANNLNGELPDSLGKLKNLTDFRIDGNPITGKIPSFIGNWSKLQRLDMQGTSMEGPLPAIFSTLSSVTDLRITDLKGDGEFPPLQNMKAMKELVLRNVSISGELPDFIGDMTKLKVLDLSFNNLTGPIPSSYDGLANSIVFLYFTNNMLNGIIPNWIIRTGKNLDLSYNSFTGSTSSCQPGKMCFSDLYFVYYRISGCLRRDFLCGENAKNYKFFINCGGSKVVIGDEEYEEDTAPLGASRFQLSGSMKWAYSSTGDFVGNEKEQYIATNASVLNMDNPKLYTTARLSPLSLKYYGFCLQKGAYMVNLHFAEIMFTDDETYASIGTRLFDVSIQGQKVLTNFNIAKEANGTGKAIIKSFNATVDGTLEIHFQWTGKGTNSIPHRSVYGPLISAISVTPNFTPETNDGKKLSLGAIVGIASGCAVILVMVLLLLLFYLRREDTTNNELRGLELQAGYYSLRQIKTATMNFDPANKIGEGGFGPVYKGVLSDGSVIAVKQLSSKSRQGNREFVNEIGVISALQHPNLVKLFGCCTEGNQLLLIYEYMENNSLARALFGQRKICLGIARGLAYLHEESTLRIVHRDIKATNILLDRELNAKISDFGLAKLDEDENTHISTRIAGTIGYMAPEYATRGCLTYKADVYSFGVVTLEIVSGMSNTSYRSKEDCVYLLDRAYALQEQGNLLELVDPNLGSNFSKEEALQMLRLSLLCTNPSPAHRPIMSSVVSMLDGKLAVDVQPGSRNDGLGLKSFEEMYYDSISSTDGPGADSSAYSSQQVGRSNVNNMYR